MRRLVGLRRRHPPRHGERPPVAAPLEAVALPPAPACAWRSRASRAGSPHGPAAPGSWRAALCALCRYSTVVLRCGLLLCVYGDCSTEELARPECILRTDRKALSAATCFCLCPLLRRPRILPLQSLLRLSCSTQIAAALPLARPTCCRGRCPGLRRRARGWCAPALTPSATPQRPHDAAQHARAHAVQYSKVGHAVRQQAAAGFLDQK
jgi:hypothetical protein